jgi:hypothetical protein
MKNLRFPAAFILAAMCAVIVVTSCGKDGDDEVKTLSTLTGTVWKGGHPDSNTDMAIEIRLTTATGGEIKITNRNGTEVVYEGDLTYTYDAASGKVTATYELGKVQGTVKDGKMTCTGGDSGDTYVLTLQK